MKRVILIATVSSIIGFSCGTMAIGPIDGKTYGKINISVVNDDQGEKKHWQVEILF